MEAHTFDVGFSGVPFFLLLLIFQKEKLQLSLTRCFKPNEEATKKEKTEKEINKEKTQGNRFL